MFNAAIFKEGIKIQNFNNILKFWKDKERKFDTFDNKNCSFITTDIHGDLNALLNFLISTGFAYFDDNEELYKEYKINDNDAIKIPNLKINKNFNKNLFILGDLIDRGSFSNECFYLVKDIIEQIDNLQMNDKNAYENLKDRFQFLIGNHEMNSMMFGYDILSEDYKKLYIIGSKNDFDNIGKDLIKLLLNGRIKVCTNIGNNVFGSHVVYKKNDIEEIIKIVQKYENMDREVKELSVKFQELNNGPDKKLQRQSLPVLEEMINKLSVFIISNKNYLPLEQKNEYYKVLSTLLCKITANSKEENINNLFQVVGHEISGDHKALNKVNAIYADFEQSSGFLEQLNYSYPTYLVFDKDKNIFHTVSFFHNILNDKYEHNVIQDILIPSMYIDYINNKIDEGKNLDNDEIERLEDMKMKYGFLKKFASRDNDINLFNFFNKFEEVSKKVDNLNNECSDCLSTATDNSQDIFDGNKNIIFSDDKKKSGLFSCFKINKKSSKNYAEIREEEKQNRHTDFIINYYN